MYFGYQFIIFLFILSKIHYELGCGDGRLCFYAVDAPYNVKKSVGIDVDANLITAAWNRVAKRHPKPQNIDFIVADLTNTRDKTTRRLWEQIREECTILTMLFVEDGLQQLKPLFEKYLKGSNVKIVTMGYPMSGWKTAWEEVVLDLRIYLYHMKNIMGDDNGDNLFEDDHFLVDTQTEYSSGQDYQQQQRLPQQHEAPFLSNEEKGPPLQRLEYDLNEDVDNHWDDFDQDSSSMKQIPPDPDGKEKRVK